MEVAGKFQLDCSSLHPGHQLCSSRLIPKFADIMTWRRSFWILAVGLGFACSSEKQSGTQGVTEQPVVSVPGFNADSAFNYVKKQVDAGPRVPGTETHGLVGDYLVETLKGFGAEITEQEFTGVTFDGTEVPLRNIIGAFYPERSKRIMLAAHWDTRPFADKDEVNTDQPIDGANDGASGVGVLLEIARQISVTAPPNVGVDIVLFDGEDWGERINDGRISLPDSLESWYCLGSQYWARNKHKQNYAAYYGILLDMVGARGSQFHQEGLSMRMAPRVVRKIWDRAEMLGYGGIFVKKRKGEITDDHTFVNRIGKIPMVNIVHYDPEYGYFGEYHHTHRDNIQLIDPNMLNIVGTTVLHVIYHE